MEIKSEKSRYHRFAFYFDYTPDRVEFCRILKDSFGWQRFSFDSTDGLKRWCFSETIFVKLLAEQFRDLKIDPVVMSIWQHEEGANIINQKRDEVVEAVKEKSDTDFKVTGVKGELYPYQKVGVEFLTASGGRAIIADQMGTGKTCQSISYVAHMKLPRTLVVCPASVKASWAKETEKWTNLSYIVIDSKTKVSEIPADVRVWIINYDLLRKHFDALLKTRFDALIADEAHYLKGQSTLRTKAVRQLARNIERVILLSGTPLLSRPVEMFTLLNMVDPAVWNNYYEFTRKYCDGKQGPWGYDASGASNIEELHGRIKKYFIRRLKEDVLTQLPPKNRIDTPVELDKDIRDQYDQAENNLVAYLKEHAGKQPAEIARMIQAEKLTQLNILRQLCAIGKLPAAEEIIDSALDAGEKILVFSSFVDPLQRLQAKYKDQAVMLTGATPVEERGAIVERFQKDPKVKVFLGGIKSAGVGITLTAAQNVLFLDFAWNPADHQQAEDRIHRPGQVASSVNIYQLYSEGTIDEKLRKILKHKQRIFDRVVVGATEEKDTSGETMNEVVNDLMERKGAKWKPMELSTPDQQSK